MNVPSVTEKLKTENWSMEEIARSSRLNETEKIEALSRGFEAVLLRNILENAQKPVLDPDGEGSSSTSSIYRDLITNQLADSISRSGTLGLGNDFKQQLVRQNANKDARSPDGESKESQSNQS
jgi:Rod binding domain-containing protein